MTCLVILCQVYISTASVMPKENVAPCTLVVPTTTHLSSRLQTSMPTALPSH